MKARYSSGVPLRKAKMTSSSPSRANKDEFSFDFAEQATQALDLLQLQSQDGELGFVNCSAILQHGLEISLRRANHLVGVLLELELLEAKAVIHHSRKTDTTKPESFYTVDTTVEVISPDMVEGMSLQAAALRRNLVDQQRKRLRKDQANSASFAGIKFAAKQADNQVRRTQSAIEDTRERLTTLENRLEVEKARSVARHAAVENVKNAAS